MKKNSGQIALIVLLVMVVMLTLGISIAQRGVTDVRISQQEEDSARALQAAETGVEEALATLVASSGELGGDASYATDVVSGGGNGFVSGQPIAEGEVLYINLVGGSPNLNRIDVYFIEQGKDDCTTTLAAVEVIGVYISGGNSRVRRAGYDVVSSRNNGFTKVAKGNYSFEGKTFCGKATFNLTANDREVRIRPVYNRATLGVDPGPSNATLNMQYVEVESVGKTMTGVSRAVTVRRGEPQLPSIFDYAVFSGTGIVK